MRHISKGGKNNVKSQRKHWNQTWQGCWNDQTEFKTTMTSMLRAVDKVGHVRIDGQWKKMKMLGNNQKEMVVIKKKTSKKGRKLTMGLLVDLTQLRKESLGLRIPQ